MQNTRYTKEQLESHGLPGRLFFLLLISTLTVFSCVSDRNNNLDGLWVGGNIQIDRNHFSPIPSVLKIKGDRAAGVNVMSMDTFQVPISIDSSGLHVDTSTYAPNHFKLEKNQFSYRKAYPINYWRSSMTRPNISRLSLRAALIGTTWSWYDFTIQFESENELNIVYHEKEYSGQHCWFLKTIHDLCLLTIQGNFKDCEGLQFPLIQILNYSDNELEVLSSIDGERTFSSWKKVASPEPIKLSDFQICNPHLNLNMPGAMYYYKGTKVEGGHYAIWKEIKARKEKLDLKGISGLVRVRFVVNCIGLTGRFESETFNEQYELMDVPRQVTQQLVDLTKSLRPWKVGQHPTTSEKIDTYYFITYRINDGEIVDLFP